MTTFDIHKNFARSVVATAPAPAGTGKSLKITKGDGTKFPAPPFNATIWPKGTAATTTNAEIVRVTSVVGDTFEVSRKQEGSELRNIAIGDNIEDSVTVRTLTDVEEAINSEGTRAITAEKNLHTRRGQGEPTALTCPDGATYFEMDNSEQVFREWAGTPTGPIAVAEVSPIAGGDLIGQYPNPEVVKIKGHKVGEEKVAAAVVTTTPVKGEFGFTKAQAESLIALSNSLREMAIKLSLMKE